jgi:hypothetical protein
MLYSVIRISQNYQIAIIHCSKNGKREDPDSEYFVHNQNYIPVGYDELKSEAGRGNVKIMFGSISEKVAGTKYFCNIANQSMGFGELPMFKFKTLGGVWEWLMDRQEDFEIKFWKDILEKDDADSIISILADSFEEYELKLMLENMPISKDKKNEILKKFLSKTKKNVQEIYA